MKFTILRFDSLDSTNTEAANQARQGADEGLCIIAGQQTAGRGRHGRTWVSQAGDGLYFSIVLRPATETRFLPLITLMAGVAVYDALKEFGLKPDIKWVNDVLVGEKKICGILAETVETPRGLAVVVGIGINLKSVGLPDEIAEISTSIQKETGKTVRADDLAESLTRYAAYFYEILNQKDGSLEIRRHWQRRSSYFSQKPVSITISDEIFTGTTDGLEENGALRVIRSDGSVTIVQAGDIERLREI
ncbi:MAG: biotin--[acetyl-CoA-carboxylase] ligase [Pyrinomonadaceae bacterium]